MAELDENKYAYRVKDSGDSDWTIEVATGGFPQSFEGEGETEYEVKVKVWSDSAFITTGQSSFVPVSKPSGVNVQIPFNIERNGNVYRPELSFNLLDYANVTVTKTYYVDSVNGNDAFDGLSENTPIKTLTEASSRGDAQRLFLKRGSVWQKNQRPTQFNGSMLFQTYGTGNKPRITSLVSNQVGILTKTSNYWSGSVGDNVANVIDTSVSGTNGLGLILTNAGSIAGVDSTPNSFYLSGSTIYIRLNDDRTPDSSVEYYDALALRTDDENCTQYFENIEINGAFQARAGVAGGLKCLMLNCDFKKVSNPQFWGCEPSIIWDCTSNIFGDDCINIDDSNGVQGNHIEIDCSLTSNALGSTSSQSSTAHNTSLACRIGGQYFNVAGQCIADVNSSQSWNMGMSLSDSALGVGFYIEGETWVEGTDFGTNAKGITVTVGSTFHYKNNSLDVIVSGGGSYVAY